LGIIVSGRFIEAWIERSVLEIAGSDKYLIGSIISLEQHDPFFSSRILRFFHPKHMLIGLFHLMDRIYFKISNNALARRNILELVSLLNKPLYVKSDNLGSLPELINQIQKQQNIQLWVSYSYKRLPDNVFNLCPEIKCLFFEFSRYSYEGINDLGLTELTNVDGEIRSTLVIRSDERLLEVYPTSSMTDVFSQQLTLNNHLWKICHYIPMLLPEILSGDYLLKRCGQNIKNPAEANPELKTVTGRNMMFLILNKVKNSIYKRISKEQWILLYSPKNWAETIKTPSLIKSYFPPPGKFWADPFVMQQNDEIYIFFEEFEHKIGKGHISHLVCDKDGKILDSGKVLERPYHLAYPYIFEYKDHLYMIPDSSENHSIELYRCIRFPDQWQFVKTIMNDVVANDTSVIIKDNKVWLFTCMTQKEVRWNYDELYIFHSPDLMGDLWTSHRLNPVFSDVRRARSAGKIFEYEGDLFRPSQDCSHHYGRALNINRIEILDEENYSEKCIYQINSTMLPYLDKIHTMNSVSAFTVMDGSIVLKSLNRKNHPK
jgi:hypothetical protein